MNQKTFVNLREPVNPNPCLVQQHFSIELLAVCVVKSIETHCRMGKTSIVDAHTTCSVQGTLGASIEILLVSG